MRAHEIIVERSFPKRKSSVLSTTYEFPSMPSADPYKAYRFGMAMADHTLDYKEGPVSNHAVAVAYTDGDEEIIQNAARQTGHKGKLVADRGSNEPQDTYSISPVAKKKKNRWGV